MPKKKRKGRPHHRKPTPKRSTPPPVGPAPVDLPREAAEPLLRLEFTAKATPQEVERAIGYWTPLPEGGWAQPVSALGSPSKVAAEVAAVCEAYLPEHLCGTCAAPTRVRTRSDAVAVAGHDLRSRTSAGLMCSACRRAHELRQAEEARAAEERTRAARQARKDQIDAFFERQQSPVLRSQRREGQLTVDMACVLMAMLEYAEIDPVLPTRSTLSLGWLWPDPGMDVDLLGSLRSGQWITIDARAPLEHFTFDDDGKLTGFYPARVPFRLATSPEETHEDMMVMLLAHSKSQNLQQIQHHIRRMQARSLARYLEHQLQNQYQYPPVPESKAPELHRLLLDGLQDYTFGQMVCFLWRAADTAAGWKERKQLSDAHASSAAVTVLQNKIDNARECRTAIPEYDLPRSHVDPPALMGAQRLLGELQERIDAGLECELHDHALPCGNCLGMLYGGGEDAQRIREYYASFGAAGLRLRPDLAIKPQINATT